MSQDPGPQTPSRLPLYVGIVLVVLGWAAIGLGWFQAGRQELDTGQIPYVISGGFGGFGLLLMGMVAILADIVRQAETKLRRSADQLHGRMEEVANTFVDLQTGRVRGARRTAGEPDSQKSARRRPRRTTPASRQRSRTRAKR